MKVFSWKGEIDTIMKPVDSISYYKHFFKIIFNVDGTTNRTC